MAFRGWDLEELWQGRRWRFLLNLVNRLPRNTHFVMAMADDVEAAEAWLATEPEDAEPVIPLSEWSSEREALERIADGINAVVHAVVASAGAKPGALKPGLRPVTAFDRVREEIDERRRSNLHRKLMTQLGLG